MFLIDTNVLSEMRKGRPHGAVVAWFGSLDPDAAFLPSVVAGEIQAAIERMRRNDAKKAADIEKWLDELLQVAQEVPADSRVYRQQALLLARKRDMEPNDALVAATAKVHGLTLATRNVRDFAGLGLMVINPFKFR
jgi:hypothetical protein